MSQRYMCKGSKGITMVVYLGTMESVGFWKCNHVMRVSLTSDKSKGDKKVHNRKNQGPRSVFRV